MRMLPSIRARLARALGLISILWCLAVTLAVALVVRHEVDELMDNSLQESAEIIHGVLELNARQLPLGRLPGGAMAAAPHEEHLVWQLVDADGTVLLRSHRAPDRALRSGAVTGLGDAGDQWRVYGVAFGAAGEGRGLMLYVAQEMTERAEVRADSALYAIVAALGVGLLCAQWLRVRLRRELLPLAELSAAVSRFDPLQPGAVLPPASRTELAPMQRAITDLGERLARRVANERAFTAHAAHALRTPLAGMDAQLAVALRECPPELRPRLVRSREAVGRLRRVVSALLTLFRSGAEPRWEALQLDELLVHLPFEGLDLQARQTGPLQADPDLLAAALLNLLDNAQRHGATQVIVCTRGQGEDTLIELHDDGRGIEPAERLRLQAALDAQDYATLSGLGLMLADLVARTHGGALHLLETPAGFGVRIRLGPPPVLSAPMPTTTG